MVMCTMFIVQEMLFSIEEPFYSDNDWQANVNVLLECDACH